MTNFRRQVDIKTSQLWFVFKWSLKANAQLMLHNKNIYILLLYLYAALCIWTRLPQIGPPLNEWLRSVHFEEHLSSLVSCCFVRCIYVFALTLSMGGSGVIVLWLRYKFEFIIFVFVLSSLRMAHSVSNTQRPRSSSVWSGDWMCGEEQHRKCGQQNGSCVPFVERNVRNGQR